MATTTSTFQGLYRKLNKEQKEAVDTIEGPVMVIAGPGTGKTQILTLRIANILRKTDASPDSILALTFTESGVFSMRKKLVEIIGSAGYRVRICTFHGFCNDVIKQNPDEFPRVIGSDNITDIDKLSILREIIINSALQKLKPFGNNFYYLNPIRQKIADLKRENISPADLEKLLKKQEKEFKATDDLYYTEGKYKGKMRGKYLEIEKHIEKNEELLEVYKRYEDELRIRKLYDYEDMIIEVIMALEKKSDLLLRLQEEYQYILADEHQDANNSQNRLLELLAQFHDSPNLFIVGDEKQAIFRFQGASLENFLYFKNRYPEAFIVTLETGYRSSQAILDSAHSLIMKGEATEEGLRKKLFSYADPKGHQIESRAFSNETFEYFFLATDIKKKIDEGIDPKEIAVLYRTNRDVEQVLRALEQHDIPFVIESDQNVLADIDVRKLILLFRAVQALGDDSLLLSVLHINFLELSELDIYKLVHYAQKEHLALYDCVKDTKILSKAGVKEGGRFHDLYKKLITWSKAGRNTNLLTFFDTVLHESGFLQYILNVPQTQEKLEKVNGLFDEIKSLASAHHDWRIDELIEYLDLLEEHKILIKKESRNIATRGVRLMTAHKSKGLEFDYVYVVGVYDTHWGNQRGMKHFNIPIAGAGKPLLLHSNEDERRLLYVALTRARTGVYISYPKESETGKQLLPSQFLEEIDKKFIKEVDTSEFEKNITKEDLFRPKKVKHAAAADKAFLNELFIEQGFSVTALNNFLKSPWQYFYANLLRVPATPSKHQLFGIAIHTALKAYFDSVKRGEERDLSYLLLHFEQSLLRQPLSRGEFEESLLRGTEALSGYFKKYKGCRNANILNEFSVQGALPLDLPDLPSIKLRGIFDKVEFIDERRVHVVDYKTGKPKSRNDIEGKTKNSEGDYKRQLVFYKLLLDLFDGGKYIMESGEIDFIQPDNKGIYHKELFEVTDEEVEKLKEIISESARHILDLSFWDAPCNTDKCDFCHLRDWAK